jgi:hypothetical protein
MHDKLSLRGLCALGGRAWGVGIAKFHSNGLNRFA